MRDKISHVHTERAWVRGVGIDLTLQSCCSWCYVIQPVYHTLHECVVGCPILSSTNEHVPFYHFIVLDSTPSYTLCALTSHHRVRCSSGLKHVKHHQHVTNTPCKAPQKSVEGATALFVCLSVLSSWMIGVRDKKHGTCLRNGRGCAAWALI